MRVSRRTFLETSATVAAVAGTAGGRVPTSELEDGPRAGGFAPLPITGNIDFGALADAGVSQEMAKAVDDAPRGQVVCWGLPFSVNRPVLLKGEVATETIDPVKVEWLVFLHTADREDAERNEHGLLTSKRGEGRLGEAVADYVVVFSDGTEARERIKRRHHVGMFQRHWGENCFQAVAHAKPYSVQPVHEAVDLGKRSGAWGGGETRVNTADQASWMNWLWAWKNPHPGKEIIALRFEPRAGTTIISGVSSGVASAHPLRWEPRRKAILKLPEDTKLDPTLGDDGLLAQVQLDMGQVISAEPRPLYPRERWPDTDNNEVPEISKGEVLVEYAAHPDARFHLVGGQSVPASDLVAGERAGPLTAVSSALQRVTIRAVERETGTPVPVKLHVHGESGEYLAPVDRTAAQVIASPSPRPRYASSVATQ